MRGADVVKGLCLGAAAVGMGRFEALAMAAGGEPVVLRALEILEHEVLTTMALMGINDIEDLNEELLEKVEPITHAHVLSAFPLLEEGY